MSKYTTEVRFYCETLAGYNESQDYGKINEIVQKAAPLIFEDFPIYDEAYRIVLETKILKHYYVREICAETPALWKLWLNNRMNEIMPYYNELYKSALLEFDPFYDVDITTEHKGDSQESKEYNEDWTDSFRNHEKTDTTVTASGSTDSNGQSTSTSENSKVYDHLNQFAATPQGGPQGPIFTEYLTNATQDHDQENTNGTASTQTEQTSRTTSDNVTDGTINSDGASNGDRAGTHQIDTTNSYIQHVRGKKGFQSYSSLLMEFRKTLINIDRMIIEDLADLFFNLY